MATSIPAVSETAISHAIIIDLTLDDTTYYISSAYKPITHGGNTYTELGALLSVSNIVNDIKTTNGDVQVALTGIPSLADYMNIMLSSPIKGGEVIIRRVFFNPETMEVADPGVFERYRGIITNYSIEENMEPIAGELTSTVSVICASKNTLLENRIPGQRTNGTDRRRYFPDDISFDRVKDLQNTSFDFGREFRGGGGGGGGYVNPFGNSQDSRSQLDRLSLR